MKEHRLRSIDTFIVFYSITFLFVTEILLGVYLYRAKSEIHEIRQILDDPKFCELYGCHKTKKKDDHIWNTKKYEELLVANTYPIRKKRSNLCAEFESEGCLTKGEPGIPGITGIPGIPGQKGAAGHMGSKGSKGEKGNSGIPGSSGLKGDMGLVGVSGGRGEKGLKGVTGAPGIPGKGLHGEKGVVGPIGPMGPKGDKGDFGTPGIPGLKGDTGLTGNPGKKGEQCHPDSQGLGKIVTFDKDYSYPGLPARAAKCLITNADDPLFKFYSLADYTDITVDTNPVFSDDGERFYRTHGRKNLFEFSHFPHYNNITLDVEIEGNAHVISTGCFFYHAAPKRPCIIKYNLHSRNSQVLDIPGISPADLKLLYSTKESYLDFNVDENGLWVLFSIYGSTDIKVIKINSSIMQIQTILNVKVEHEKFEEMFIASGVLYGIKREGEVEEAKILFAVDLYTGQSHDVNVKLNNWYKPKTATFDYKHKNLHVFGQEGVTFSYRVDCK